MRRRSLTAIAVVAAMHEARRAGIARISFTGGEPTIRNDLLALVRKASALGFTEIKIQTNGLLLGAGDNLARLVAAGLSQVHVSIHTHDRDAYEAMVGRAGSYDAMVAGLRALVAAAVPCAADVIVQRSTMTRLPDAITWLHEIGIAAADLWFVSLTDGNRDNVASLPRFTEAVPFVGAAIDRGVALGMRVRSLHLPRCVLAQWRAHAWDPAAGGVVVVSPDARFDLRQSRLTPNRHVEACSGCSLDGECKGVRPDYVECYGQQELVAARRDAGL
jgi:cyclic pyranopterin phosphate synthase